VMAHRGLREPRGRDEMANARLGGRLGGDEAQQPQASRVGDRLEPVEDPSGRDRARSKAPLGPLLFHKVHHSSRHLDWLATFRSHLVEQLLRRALAPLVLIAAGVPFPAVGIAAAIFFAWATFNHANFRLPLGLLECVLMTPRLHRVHHVSATTERNLGTVLTCWDRLRGSFLRADPPPDATFGLPRERRTSPRTGLANSWRRGMHFTGMVAR
jgi:hypothetical protein